MGAEVLRSHGGARSRRQAAELGSTPPAKAGRSPNPARHTRNFPRRTTLLADASPGGRSSPAQAKPFRNSTGNSTIPGRSGRWGRIPEIESQMVVKAPARSLVMEEVTILKRGETAEPRRPAEDRPLSDREEAAKLKLPGEDRHPSDREAAAKRERLVEDRQPSNREEATKPKRPAEDPQPSDRREAGAVEAGGDDLALCSTARLGPDPEILPKQMRIVERKSPMYAGSGFFTSPSPRSLPLPTSFFAKKEVANTTDLATRGLRYLLRLDLP